MLETIELTSMPPAGAAAAAAPPPITIPEDLPADAAADDSRDELPIGPRFSLLATAPTMLPPTAPLIS